MSLSHNWKGAAIVSLIAGITSVVPIIFLFSTSFLPQKMISFSYLSIIGIILGIKGLKSPKRNIAIMGIIFSIIGMLGLIIFFLIRLGFQIGM